MQGSVRCVGWKGKAPTFQPAKRTAGPRGGRTQEVGQLEKASQVAA